MNAAYIFDYGGTLDTDSIHWSWVLWDSYRAEGVNVSLSQFRECYVHAERTLERQPLVLPHHNMLDLLRIKVDVETKYLADNHYIDEQEVTRRAMTEHIALRCYNQTRQVVNRSRQVLSQLSQRNNLALVSNFYGNLHAVLSDFNLDTLFPIVIESAVVGVRKPDPKIFQLAIDALHVEPHDAIVVGDSFSNDIKPALDLGCQAVWIRSRGWEDIDSAVPTSTPPQGRYTILQNLEQLL